MGIRQSIRVNMQDWAMRQMNEMRPETVGQAVGEVLDIGFGTGINLEFYPAAVTAVTALDPMEELTERVRASASIPDDIEGVLVVEVNPRSNAQSEGLARGDVIIEVNKGDISDLDDYRKQVQKNEDKPVLLRVYRPGRGRLFIAVPR